MSLLLRQRTSETDTKKFFIKNKLAEKENLNLEHILKVRSSFVFAPFKNRYNTVSG